jgi:hypothetical protein
LPCPATLPDASSLRHAHTHVSGAAQCGSDRRLTLTSLLTLGAASEAPQVAPLNHRLSRCKFRPSSTHASRRWQDLVCGWCAAVQCGPPHFVRFNRADLADFWSPLGAHRQGIQEQPWRSMPGSNRGAQIGAGRPNAAQMPATGWIGEVAGDPLSQRQALAAGNTREPATIPTQVGVPAPGAVPTPIDPGFDRRWHV